MGLLDNIVAFWKLEEASGTRVDEVGSNDLADNNTVTQVAGKIGNAAQFTAANSEYLEIADNADLSTGDIDFTFACWVWFDSLPAVQSVMGSKGNTAGNQLEWFVDYQTAADRLRFVVTPDGSGPSAVVVNADSFGTPSTGQWIFVVAWHDSVANTINIQVNNGAVDSLSHSGGLINGNAAFRLGTRIPSVGNFLDGRLDAAGFWKKIPSASERTELWNNGNGKEHPFGIFIVDAGSYAFTGQSIITSQAAPLLVNAGIYTFTGKDIITAKSVPFTIPRQFASVLIDDVAVDDKWISLDLRRRDEEATDVLTLELADNSLHSSFNFNKLPKTPQIQVATANAIPKADGSTSSTTILTSNTSDFVLQGVTTDDCVKVIFSSVAADIGVWKITSVAATILTTNHTFGDAAAIAFIVLVNQGKFFGEKPDVLEDLDKVVIPSLWGRNEIARLTDPFALKITRTYLDKTSMTAIVKALLDEAGLDSSKAIFDISDYTVPGGLLRVVDQFPMQIIVDLVSKTNGYVRSDKLGNLHIKKKFFHFGAITSVKALADDDLHGDMQEALDFPEFGNRILIRSSIPSSGQAVQVQIKSATRCLRGDSFSQMEVLGIVRDDEGKPVPDGLLVDFTIDNSALATFLDTPRPTRQRSIVDEFATSSSLTSVSTDFPIVDVRGVFLETDATKSNNFFTGGSFGGTRITLGIELPFTDSAVLIDYTAGGIAVATLKAINGAPETDTTIRAAVGKVRASTSFCISNRRNGSISLSAKPTEHNICNVAVRTSDIRARVIVDGLPAQGAMIRWTVAGIGSVSPVFSAVRNTTIDFEIGKPKNVFTAVTKFIIVSVVGVWLEATGKAGTNFFTNEQDRMKSFKENEITLGTDLPATDASLIIEYVAAAIAATVYTAPEQIGAATVTATLNTGEERGLETNINISVVNRCTPLLGTGKKPTGADQDCSDSVATARTCANQPTQGTRVECICVGEGLSGGCPSPDDCKSFCTGLYNKYGLNPLDCETVPTAGEISDLQTAFGVIILSSQAKAFEACDKECQGDPDCVAVCVPSHRDATIERCEQTCKDHGISISPEETTMPCGDPSPTLTYTVSGGTPPFFWSTTTNGVISTSGDNNENATLIPPPNAGGFPSVTAYTKAGYHVQDTNSIPACNQPECCNGCIESCRAISGVELNLGCDGGEVSNLQGISCGFGLPKELLGELLRSNDINCSACVGFDNSNSDLQILQNTERGELVDKRTQAMKDAGCLPCAVALAGGGVVTVKDSLGNEAMATVSASV